MCKDQHPIWELTCLKKGLRLLFPTILLRHKSRYENWPVWRRDYDVINNAAKYALIMHENWPVWRRDYDVRFNSIVGFFFKWELTCLKKGLRLRRMQPQKFFLKMRIDLFEEGITTRYCKSCYPLLFIKWELTCLKKGLRQGASSHRPLMFCIWELTCLKKGLRL